MVSVTGCTPLPFPNTYCRWSWNSATLTDLLDGRTAVVTGAANGIGRGIALSLAHHGANVVVADIDRTPRNNEPPTDRVIEEETASSAAFVECDVTCYEDLVAACERANEFGGLDIMVNNAGVVRDVNFMEGTGEDFDDVIEVNLKGTYYGCQAAAEQMLGSGGGVIINISSTGADRGFEDPGGALYCDRKAA